MRLAILTDIHGNAEALAAVLGDQAARGCERIAILGDIVGYGPDPAWCVETVGGLVERGAICLLGNHDAAALGRGGAMNPTATAAIHWTRSQLSPQHLAFLAGLPLTAALGDLFLAHASAEAPGDWIYITSDLKAVGAFRACRARLIVVGHVHVPLLVSQDLSGAVREQRAKPGLPMPLIRSRRWLAVVGAVGQPRDRDPRAAYAIYDSAANELSFRKVAYDCARTAAKLRAAGLPEALALRLLSGD